MTSSWISSLGLGMVVLVSGCVSSAPRPDHSGTICHRLDSSRLGTIGIVSTSTIPQFVFNAPMAKGTALNAAHATEADSALFTPPIIAVLTGPAVVSTMLVRNATIAFRAPGQSTVTSAEESIKETMRATVLQDELRTAILHRSWKTLGHFVVVQKPFPPGEEQEYRKMATVMSATLAWLPNHQQPTNYLRAEGVDTMLEVHLENPGLENHGGINPGMRLTIVGTARVVDLRTKMELASCAYSYRGEKHRFVAWGENNAQLLREELRKAYEQVAEKSLANCSCRIDLDQRLAPCIKRRLANYSGKKFPQPCAVLPRLSRQ